jgi:N-acetylmuramoyl-L-alanine amidase
MTGSRIERREQSRARRRSLTVGLAVVGGIALLVASVNVVAGLAGSRSQAELASSSLQADVATVPAAVSTPAASAVGPAVAVSDTRTAANGSVEVPSVLGKRLDEAEMILSYAGMTIQVTSGARTAGAAVVSQRPVAGEVGSTGTTVTVTLGKTVTVPRATRHFVVCVDPGHQAVADAKGEPLGPGSREMKPSASAGARGAATGAAESEVALAIAKELRRELVSRGVQVVMTRTTDKVRLSNRQRAEIANRAAADLFVRVHADGSANRSTHGISTLFPAGTRWTKAISGRSERAARVVHRSVVHSTGASDRGIVSRGDITGFNWSRVPAIIVETGFLSNPGEDRLLATSAYRRKLAAGMADGIMAYLEGRSK